jgi:CubicO group peptidase (beta-lactamase class C family)
MRFRRLEWDVAMPDALVAYWTAWNERDLDRVREHLARAVTEDVAWDDPRDSFVGRDELEAAVRRLRTSKPEHDFVIASEIDAHHGRLRYRWDMTRGGRTLMEGLDVVTLDPATGLIARVDGFFGHPTPIAEQGSGVPSALRRATASSGGEGDERGRLAEQIDEVAADVGFSGVVRVDVDGAVVVRAHGLADRAHGVANAPDTQFAVASASKTLTALAVMSLVDDGTLTLTTTARSLLGADLPLIAADVTVEQLLAHRSGIGDYLDEDELDDSNDHVLTVPVHQLATTAGFLPMLDGLPMQDEPGARFSYCNGGFMVLALLAERAAGTPFHDLVDRRVCAPAGLPDTAYLRSDELPGRAAIGYLHDDGLRSNVLHLPVRGNGDGGIYSTAADIRALWEAVFAGRVVSLDAVAEMTRPRSDVPDMSMQYGLGCWLDGSTGAVRMLGGDAGVGVVSTHHPEQDTTVTVLCNQTRGAWPTSERVGALVAATR